MIYFAKRSARAALLLGFLLAAPIAHAQVPVGLVHGISSDGGTWNELRAALSGSPIFSFPVPPSMASGSGFASQAGELLAWKFSGGFGPEMILAAHSQGGLISRFASRTDSVRGLVTIGTPHLGASIASAQGTVQDYWIEASIASGAVQYLQDIEPWEDLYYEAQQALQHVPIAIANLSLVLGVGTQFFAPYNQSLIDLTPGSQILSGNNGLINNSGLERIGSRLAIATATDSYLGGPVRLIVDDVAAHSIGLDLQLWSFQLFEDALNLEGVEGFWHIFAQYGLFDFSFLLGDFPGFWHYDVVGGFPNDVVVPTFSQAAMPSPFLPALAITSVSHVEQTKRWQEIHGRLTLIP